MSRQAKNWQISNFWRHTYIQTHTCSRKLEEPNILAYYLGKTYMHPGRICKTVQKFYSVIIFLLLKTD